MSVYGPPSRVVSGWDKNGRPTSLFDSTQRLYGTDRGSARDMTVAAFPRADGIECSRRQAHLELLLRSAKGLEAYARRRKYQSQVPLARVVSRLAKLIKGAPFADRSHRRDQARKTVDAYILEAQRILAYARQQFDQGRPSAAIQRVADLEKRHRDPWRPATQHARDRARPLFTRECPRNRESTDYVVTRCIPRAATAVHAPQHSDMEIAGNTRHYMDVFDVAGGLERGDRASDWRKFRSQFSVPLARGNTLEVDALDTGIIRSLTIARSETEVAYAKGTLRWADDKPPEHAPDYANLTFEPRRPGLNAM